MPLRAIAKNHTYASEFPHAQSSSESIPSLRNFLNTACALSTIVKKIIAFPRELRMNTLLPEQIKAKLRGQQFETFTDFKSALWSTYANDATCSKQFGTYQLNRMKKGWPPRAPFHQTLEGLRSYELCNHGPEAECHDLNAKCCGRAAPVERLPPKRLADYTAADFLALIQTIMSATGTTEYQDALLEHFIEVVDHPDGSDLIYPLDPADERTAEQVLATLVAWRTSNQLPLFTDLR